MRAHLLNRRRLVLPWLLSLVVVAGVHAAEFNFTIDTPADWWRVASDKYLVITRDGAFRHYILVQERPLAVPFKNTQKTIKPGMLPHEAAQVVIDEMSADIQLKEFQLIENVPATVAGFPGFRTTFMYRDPTEMIFKTVYYGFIANDHFYNVRYAASGKDYFTEESWLEFKKVLESLRIGSP